MTRAGARLAAAVAVLVLTAQSAPSQAKRKGADPKRRVAILEYRSGSPELEAIDRRLTVILRKITSLQIIDGQDARNAYGTDLDQRVVQCAGEAECIADIGAKVGADEVLLVGVSEFGDVILTLQRIDVRQRKVANRLAEALGQGEVPDRNRLERYLRRVMPKSDFTRYGTIRIDSSVAGATVTLDGKPRGKTPIMPIRVRAPASYKIALRKGGHIPFRATVAVPPDGEVKVRPTLSRRVKQAWYKRWWVAAIVGTATAGAVAAIVIFGRDDPTDVPGSIPPF